MATSRKMWAVKVGGKLETDVYPTKREAEDNLPVYYAFDSDRYRAKVVRVVVTECATKEPTP